MLWHACADVGMPCLYWWTGRVQQRFRVWGLGLQCQHVPGRSCLGGVVRLASFRPGLRSHWQHVRRALWGGGGAVGPESAEIISCNGLLIQRCNFVVEISSS